MFREVAQGTQLAQELAAANLEDLQLASFPGPAQGKPTHFFLCCVVGLDSGPKACADSQEIRLDCAIGSGQEQEGVGWLAADKGKLLSVATSHTIPVKKRQARQAQGSSDG